MQMHERKLVVIFAESVLERGLVDEVKRLGATGYTVVDCRGGGAGGERGALWDSDRTIRLEVICDARVADAVVEAVTARFLPHYSLSLYVTDVEVMRGEKF
jgi:hypothetical protein